MRSNHPYADLIRTVKDRLYFSLPDLNETAVKRMPYCMRILLEAAVRHCDNFQVLEQDVNRLLDWQQSSTSQLEIAFKPARVLLQDFTGVPAVVDLAAMRDAMASLGADPQKVNPLCPTDLVIDHSVVVDVHGSADALAKNEEIEFDRNSERFAFLKWGQKAFSNMLVVPPGSGIVHQVNLEFLARVVFTDGEYLYPDTVVGTDSHTTMVDGLGVLGWGVGGIEAEATMLGQPSYMVVPEVVGFQLTGALPPTCTTTDLVLKIAQMLREFKVVSKLVEFYGNGICNLTVADRATISNMSPGTSPSSDAVVIDAVKEFGATAAYFPCDSQTMEYLRLTNRDPSNLEIVEAYLRANKLFRNYDADDDLISYSGTGLKLDLSTLVPAIAGPKRPHDYLPLTELHQCFGKWLEAPVGFRGFGIPSGSKKAVTVELDTSSYTLDHGAVVIAAITSCTNTSNPSVMVWAGMLAQNALRRGIKPPAYVKCSLSPGSHVVHEYLKSAGLLSALEAINFWLCGFGCQTCIGNSGDLDEKIATAIMNEDLIACSVLSGNRNFEGRIHPLTRANFLMSPPLVVAFALAGRVDHDFETQPLGLSSADNTPVYLRDIWPAKADVEAVIAKHLRPSMFEDVYSKILEGNDRWRSTPVPEGTIYCWDPNSTYIHQPPYFTGMKIEPAAIKAITNAYCLLNLGDSITTDHISPAGKIALDSPAATYLKSRGVTPQNFNSYGSRRGNDQVMVRGTFANTRILNKLSPKPGPYTLHHPSGQLMPIYDAAELYMKAGLPTIVLAGAEYGQGSSRDWAAKGPMLQGVRAVIAVNFERIHRSNLVGMGVLPLEFKSGDSAAALGLRGTERFTIETSGLSVGGTVKILVEGCAQTSSFEAVTRIDTPVELEYYYHGGILNYVLRKMASGK